MTYAVITGFFNCAILFFRSLVIQDMMTPRQSQNEGEIEMQSQKGKCGSGEGAAGEEGRCASGEGIGGDMSERGNDRGGAGEGNGSSGGQCGTGEGSGQSAAGEENGSTCGHDATAGSEEANNNGDEIVDPKRSDEPPSSPSTQPKTRDLASIFGLFNFIVGTGIIVVPIGSGSVVDAFVTFKSAFIFHGCGQLFVASLMTAAFLFARNRGKKRGRFCGGK